MKKLLVCFSFLVFHFSFMQGQDTLVLIAGEKLPVKVISLEGPWVVYTIPQNDKQQSISQSKLEYIKYKDGSRYTISQMSIENNVSSIEQKPLNKRPITLNVGIGQSIMSAAIIFIYSNDFIGQGAGSINSQSAVCNATIDYTFSNRLSLGAGAAYQWVTDNPYAKPTYNLASMTWALEKLTRYNVSTRILYHFNQHKNVDLYTGLRIGMSIWTDEMIRYNPPNPNPLGTVYPTFTGTQSNASCQLLFGAEVFPVYYLGFHIETGIGTPYFIEGGISLRVNTRKEAMK